MEVGLVNSPKSLGHMGLESRTGEHPPGCTSGCSLKLLGLGSCRTTLPYRFDVVAMRQPKGGLVPMAA